MGPLVEALLETPVQAWGRVLPAVAVEVVATETFKEALAQLMAEAALEAVWAEIPGQKMPPCFRIVGKSALLEVVLCRAPWLVAAVVAC